MKIKCKNIISDPELLLVAFRYGANKPWHIYESSTHDIEDDIHQVIKDVMREKHISRHNIRMVRTKYVMYEVVL